MIVSMTFIPEGITPEDRQFWVMPDMIIRDKNGRPKPTFPVDQVARFFFSRSGSWLRLKMHPDKDHPHSWFELDGQPLEFYRHGTYGKPPSKITERDRISARFFTLADIEPMAHSLHIFGAIDADKLATIVQLVRWEADLHGILDYHAHDNPGE